jgi:hypothetical protein
MYARRRKNPSRPAWAFSWGSCLQFEDDQSSDSLLLSQWEDSGAGSEFVDYDDGAYLQDRFVLFQCSNDDAFEA